MLQTLVKYTLAHSWYNMELKEQRKFLLFLFELLKDAFDAVDWAGVFMSIVDPCGVGA